MIRGTQSHSLAASVHAIYSASVLEVATIGCFADFHEMAPRYRVNRYPEVDLRESLSPAQSESVKPNAVMPVIPLAKALSKPSRRMPSSTAGFRAPPNVIP